MLKKLYIMAVNLLNFFWFVLPPPVLSLMNFSLGLSFNVPSSEGSPFFCQWNLEFPYHPHWTSVSLWRSLCAPHGFFECLMDSFLEALSVISAVKMIREVGGFLTEIVLEMIAFSRVFQALSTELPFWLLLFFNINGHDRKYQMMIHPAVVCPVIALAMWCT